MRLLALLVLVPGVSLAQSTLSELREGVGAAVAPAVLPGGATSVYALLGAPELVVGYRQGFGPVEAEARVRADWFRITGAAEVLARFRVYDVGNVSVAPTLGLGFVGNTGATYLEAQNFGGTFLRILPGAVASVRLADTLALVGTVEVPIDVPLQADGGSRLMALGGGGAEVYVGQGISLALLGQLGAERVDAPTAEAVWRPTWRLQAGMGMRFF
ncbi:MAG: hypothetical protein L0Y66_19360 [Myxococcaceae bacterium]|nr:hypothetical protein [Myxococcaceae bacterium]MCI0671738.1 hypothetical protein [Myxococcaceae bacterium]